MRVLIVIFLLIACAAVHRGPSGETIQGPNETVSNNDEKPLDVKEYLFTPPDNTEKKIVVKTNVKKKRVLVLPFLNRSPYGGEELAGELTRSVRETTALMEPYEVVNIQEIEGHDTFIQEGEYFLRTIYDKARVYGIQALVLGVIDDIQFREKGDEIGLLRSRFHTVTANVKFQLFDVATQKELYSQMMTEELTEEFTSLFGNDKPHEYNMGRARSALQKIVTKLSSHLPAYSKRIAWSGQIVRIDLHRYYIDAGEASGLSRGQLLSVFAPSETIKDIRTGNTMGVVSGRYKGTLQIVDYVGKDLAIAVLFSGADMKPSDRVELLYATKDN